MKTACFFRASAIAAAAATFPFAPLAARPLGDTHELVWHPSGKTPAALHRPRQRPGCANIAPHHQAGKTMPAAAARCDTRIARPEAEKGSGRAP